MEHETVGELSKILPFHVNGGRKKYDSISVHFRSIQVVANLF